MARNKTLGTDGLSIKFYLTYIDLLAPKLVQLYNAAKRIGKLPVSTRKAVIIPLLKIGKQAWDKTAYRPLSMLSLDYKILSNILATRLLPHMTTLVHEDQSGCIPTRNTALNVRRLMRVLEADT